jgi:hypothetical protein
MGSNYIHFTDLSQDEDIQEEETWRRLLEFRRQRDSHAVCAVRKVNDREAEIRFNLLKNWL